MRFSEMLLDVYLYWKYSRMTEEDWKNWEPKTWNQFKKHFIDED